MTEDRERCALAVLRRLRQGARLEPRVDGYVLAGKRSRRPVDGETVALMQARGWLRQERGGFAVSEAGLAQLALTRPPGDAFADRHRVLETKLMKDDRGRDCYVVVNAAESPLALLRWRGLIDAPAFEAGEALRRDFTLAQLTPRLGVDLSEPVGRRARKPEIVITETALAAKQRFNAALRALGPGLGDVVYDVCCMLKRIEEAEQARNWPRGSATIVLRLALVRLAEHYGGKRKKSAPIRAWAKEEGLP